MKKKAEKRPQATSRAVAIHQRLVVEFPDAACALHFRNPLELLIATILSAQCTDVRVNLVTPALFERHPTAADFAATPVEVLEEEIHSTGFYHNKAKNIIACCQTLVERYHGEVPPDLEALVSLPGVGRKTANCVLGNGFGIPSGVVVDTHVIRLSRRMGFVPPQETNAVRIEKVLMELVPQEDWILFSHRLMLHGRRTCSARKPACERCVVYDLCPKIATM